jgi:hypothetical protein
MRLGVYEILKQISQLKTEDEKIRVLRENNTSALTTVLQGAFHKNIKFLLPEGTPPYKVNNLVDQENILFREYRRMYLFVEGGHPDLNQLRREAIFIELLESVSPNDALLLLAMKEKKLPFKGITPKIVNEAFPGLL